MCGQPTQQIWTNLLDGRPESPRVVVLFKKVLASNHAVHAETVVAAETTILATIFKVRHQRDDAIPNRPACMPSLWSRG